MVITIRQRRKQTHILPSSFLHISVDFLVLSIVLSSQDSLTPLLPVDVHLHDLWSIIILNHSVRQVAIGRPFHGRLWHVTNMILLPMTSKSSGQTINLDIFLLISAKSLSFSRIR
jgi:hypothetical protein